MQGRAAPLCMDPVVLHLMAAWMESDGGTCAVPPRTLPLLEAAARLGRQRSGWAAVRAIGRVQLN